MTSESRVIGLSRRLRMTINRRVVVDVQFQDKVAMHERFFDVRVHRILPVDVDAANDWGGLIMCREESLVP